MPRAATKSPGIATEVFERDKSPKDRLQGYRLSINADGGHALKSCLPDSLYAEFVARSALPVAGLHFWMSICGVSSLLTFTREPHWNASCR